jgi:hypothetical protein
LNGDETDLAGYGSKGLTCAARGYGQQEKRIA